MYNTNRSLKGQTEIVIVLALVIVSATVIVVVSQNFLVKPEPANIAQLKLSLKSDMERLIQSTGSEIVSQIGKQGGYLNPSVETINFAGQKVPYWGVCQNNFIPTLDQITNNIKTGLVNKINSLDVKDFQAKYGKEIKLNRINPQDVDVVVRDNDIIADVYLPTFLEGFPLEMPYKITIPVNLGRIYSFASDFVKDNSQIRHFEKFIASLFYHANQKNFPTLGILGKCGESIIRTAPELQKEAQKLVDYALSKTILWEHAPPSPERKTLDDYLNNSLDPEGKELFLTAYENLTYNMTENQKLEIRGYLEDQFIPGQPVDKRKYLDYYIPSVNNNTYPDLQVSFKRGSDVNNKNFGSPDAPIALINSRSLYDWVPKCLLSFDIEYNLDMPIITSVKSGDFEFDFATYSSIEANKIGNCNYKGNFTDLEDPCADKQCSAKIFVQDTNGTAIPDTKVSFGPCLLGLTDRNGITSGKTPCGISEMVAYNPKYNSVYDVVGTSNLNKSITLQKSPAITFHFNKVIVKPDFWIPFTQYYRTGDLGRYVLANLRKGFYENYQEGFGFTLNTQPSDSDPIYVIFTPKNQRSWNPIKVLITNGAPPIKIDYNSTDQFATKDYYAIEANITKTYVDGKQESFIKEFLKEINVTDTQANVSIDFIINNTYQKDLSSVELHIANSAETKFISGSENSTLSPISFSTSNGNSSTKLLWSAILKPNQLAKFSAIVKINISSDPLVPGSPVNETSDTSSTPTVFKNPGKKGASSIVIDYLPPGKYDVEVKVSKKVKYYKQFCKRFGFFGDCKRYFSFEQDMLVNGVSKFDAEITENDKEIYINAFMPFMDYTADGKMMDYDFSNLVPTVKKYCDVQPLTKSTPDEKCQFIHWIGSSKGRSLQRARCEEMPEWMYRSSDCTPYNLKWADYWSDYNMGYSNPYPT